VTCGRSVVFSGYSVSSTNKNDRHDIAEIILKVALNTITPPHPYNSDGSICGINNKINMIHL
jgi:hypothetical protein